MTALPALTDELLAAARAAHSGRAARTLYGGTGHALRQTVIGLAAGHGLDEHESPGDATLQVLHGRVRLHTGEESQDAEAGEYLVIPPSRHSLDALDDAAVLLTVSVHG